MQPIASLTSGLVFTVLGLSLSGAAGAETAKSPTNLGEMLNAYITLLEGQCKTMGASAAGKTGEEAEKAAVANQLQKTMCECHPRKTRALLATLPREKLAQSVLFDDKVFLSVAVPGIQEPCAGEQLRSMFESQNCRDMKVMGDKPPAEIDKYCACMRGAVLEYTDAEAAAIGLEFSTYIPAMAESKKKSTPRPSRSPLLSRFVGTMEKCGGAGELSE